MVLTVIQLGQTMHVIKKRTMSIRSQKITRLFPVSLMSILLAAQTIFGQQWITNTPLPIGYIGQSLACWNGYLYQAGGEGTVHGIPDGMNVYYVQVQSDGTSGSWQSGSSLPVAVLNHAGVADNGFLYVLGGFQSTPSGGLVTTNSVYYSQINSDGSLGAWQTNTPLPLKLNHLTATVWNNIIYVAGGSGSSAVFSANINPDGSLSAWNTQPSLPVALSSCAAAANGTLYVLGGSSGGFQNTVYYSKINADGSLAGWNQTTPMPQALDFIGAVAAGGRVFFYGGYNGSAVNNFYSAPVAGDGSLGSWSPGPSLPQPLYGVGTAVAGSYIAVACGQNNSSAQRTVYSIALPPPPATPALTPQGFGANGNFQLQLTSSTNTGFGLLASTNLTTWVNIGWGFTDTNGLLTFQDTNAAGFPQRFYKAYWPLP